MLENGDQYIHYHISEQELDETAALCGKTRKDWSNDCNLLEIATYHNVNVLMYFKDGPKWLCGSTALSRTRCPTIRIAYHDKH